ANLLAIVASLLQQGLGLGRFEIVFRHLVGVVFDRGAGWTGRDLAEAVPDHVLGEIAVDGEHHGLAELLVSRRSGAVVEPEPRMRAEEFPPRAGDAYVLE